MSDKFAMIEFDQSVMMRQQRMRTLAESHQQILAAEYQSAARICLLVNVSHDKCISFI